MTVAVRADASGHRAMEATSACTPAPSLPSLTPCDGESPAKPLTATHGAVDRGNGRQAREYEPRGRRGPHTTTQDGADNNDDTPC